MWKAKVPENVGFDWKRQSNKSWFIGCTAKPRNGICRTEIFWSVGALNMARREKRRRWKTGLPIIGTDSPTTTDRVTVSWTASFSAQISDDTDFATGSRRNTINVCSMQTTTPWAKVTEALGHGRVSVLKTYLAWSSRSRFAAQTNIANMGEHIIFKAAPKIIAKRKGWAAWQHIRSKSAKAKRRAKPSPSSALRRSFLRTNGKR